LIAALEFHDSTVTGFATDGADVRISLDGYLLQWELIENEWKGTGWIRPVQIFIAQASSDSAPTLPIHISTGEIVPNDPGLFPLPFFVSGAVRLRLQLVSGEILNIGGRDLLITVRGDGRFVEDLPDEFRPPVSPRSESAVDLYYKGRRLMEVDALDDASSVLSQSAELAPHFKTLELLGECHLKTGRVRDAVTYLTAATDLNQQSRAPALLAEAFEKLGDVDRAKEFAELALMRSEDNARAKAVLDRLRRSSH